MRDRTASRLFRLRKRAEKLLHRALPRWYLPLYSMISFSTIPYDDARRRARRQDRAVVWAGVALGVALAAAVWIASTD
jgi:kynurenine 3-monooxygenase